MEKNGFNGRNGAFEFFKLITNAPQKCKLLAGKGSELGENDSSSVEENGFSHGLEYMSLSNLEMEELRVAEHKW